MNRKKIIILSVIIFAILSSFVLIFALTKENTITTDINEKKTMEDTTDSGIGNAISNESDDIIDSKEITDEQITEQPKNTTNNQNTNTGSNNNSNIVNNNSNNNSQV